MTGNVRPINPIVEGWKPDPAMSLWFTCQEGSVEKLEALLARNKFAPETIAEAFAEACLSGHHKLVATFLSLPEFDPSIDNDSAVRCCGDQPEILRLLLRDCRVDPSACDSEALVEACETSNLESVILLLEDGRVDPNADDGQPLISALYNIKPQTVDIVKLLIQAGADPTVRNNGAIKLAAASGNAEVYNLLISDQRMSLASAGKFLLRHCWSTEILSSLVTHKDLDIHAEDERGRTALHQACGAGNWSVAITLTKNGMDPLKPDKQGLTPLELMFRVATDWCEIEELVTWSVFWPRLSWLWKLSASVDFKKLIFGYFKELVFTTQNKAMRVKDEISSSEEDYEDAYDDADEEVDMEEEIM